MKDEKQKPQPLPTKVVTAPTPQPAPSAAGQTGYTKLPSVSRAVAVLANFQDFLTINGITLSPVEQTVAKKVLWALYPYRKIPEVVKTVKLVVTFAELHADWEITER